MSSDRAYECPKDGCDRVLPESRLSNHYISAHKEAYPGVGDQEPVGYDGEASDEPATTADGGRSDNPLVSVDDTDAGDRADGPVERDQTTDDEPVCPECGGELVDYRAYNTGEYHTIGGRSHYVRGDYRCSECGGWFVDE